jgi:peroxiredoxin
MRFKPALAATVFLLFISLIFISSSGMSSLKSAVSLKAPEFELTGLDGKIYSSKDYYGKKSIIISFFATWCGPCLMEMPVLQRFYENNRYLGAELLAVNIREDEPVVQKLVDKNKLAFPILMDKTGSVAREFKVKGIPALFIIDKNGKIVKSHTGYNPQLEKILKEDIISIQ